MHRLKVFQESAGRISKDISASFLARSPLKLGIWCWKRPWDIASLLSIVGQHCLFLAEAMQQAPQTFQGNRPFPEICTFLRRIYCPGYCSGHSPGRAWWECSVPGRGGNSLNFNHISAGSAKARKILVCMIRNKICYTHIILSAISAWA